MRVRFQWRPEAASQTKIRQLDGLLVLADQQVARFHVSVHYTTSVAVQQGLHDLPQHVFGIADCQRFTTFVQIFFEVLIEVLEDEVDAASVALSDHIEQLDDANVVQLLQQADFSESRRRYTFILVLDLDALQSHNL